MTRPSRRFRPTTHPIGSPSNALPEPDAHRLHHHPPLQRTADASARLSLRYEKSVPEGDSQALLEKLKSAFLWRISREHDSFTAKDGEHSPQPSCITRVAESESGVPMRVTGVSP